MFPVLFARSRVVELRSTAPGLRNNCLRAHDQRPSFQPGFFLPIARGRRRTEEVIGSPQLPNQRSASSSDRNGKESRNAQCPSPAAAPGGPVALLFLALLCRLLQVRGARQQNERVSGVVNGPLPLLLVLLALPELLLCPALPLRCALAGARALTVRCVQRAHRGRGGHSPRIAPRSRSKMADWRGIK